MPEHPIMVIKGRNLWSILGTVLFLVLMWAGYRYVSKINTPPPREKLVQAAAISPVATYSPGDVLLDLKLERDRERSRDTEEVQALIEKGTLSEATRKQAEEELWRLTSAGAKEHELQTLLEAKGYPDTMITVTQKMVMIVLAGRLDPAKAAGIAELAAEVTGFTLDRIEIVER